MIENHGKSEERYPKILKIMRSEILIEILKNFKHNER